MPGFCITNYKNDFELHNYEIEECVTGYISIGEYFIKRATLNKFLLDKCFEDLDDYVIISEGVILNKKMLFDFYDVNCMNQLIPIMYKELGDTFFDKFRGSFSGALFVKKDKKWIIYTNHYGDNAVFYSKNGNKVVVGTQPNYILDVLKANNCIISINEDAIKSMISYGYMSGDFTYANEIKRLYPGHYMTILDNDIKINKYFAIKPAKYDLTKMSEEEILNKLDEKFRLAVKLEYEKDIEYGYRHLAQLSGGLDSRMNLWVARDLGYENILCMTFAESDSMDEKIAKQIAKYLGVELIDWPLDTAKHLMHIDEYIKMNFGEALYGGIGAEKEILDSLDSSKFGVIHTGQIGDVVIGSFLNSETELQDFSIGGLYSDKLNFSKMAEGDYYDREDYLMFVRAFMGCLSSHFYTRNFTEVASPFLDIDLFEFCMSIPVRYRVGHGIYKKWILTKYPDAATFVWEKIGRRIDQKERNKYVVKAKHVIENPKLLLVKLGLARNDNKMLTGMNPMDLWWNENKELRDLYDTFFEENFESVKISNETKELLKNLYKDGNMIEKMLVITTLASIKYYDVSDGNEEYKTKN